MRHLPRVKTPGGELEALLQATPRWQAQLIEDLALLRRVFRKLAELLPPDYDVLVWQRSIAEHPVAWKKVGRHAEAEIDKLAWAWGGRTAPTKG
eukprot:2930101-Alexandrium_andersonii.AAC.1